MKSIEALYQMTDPQRMLDLLKDDLALQLFAYSIKDTAVQWLEPKPITYQQREPDTVNFKGYLPDTR